ncbi:Glycoside hydrolase, family 43 [Olea europaea subsp. europaea]|uniref:Glycoside hydrolase, family 43 n=1 Tax=Olea europaea subsp. europaea TaxID=158383 RepID=A0A8S0SG56_OLEEU|nr:Glycoside hydrolase, family 43 [Olea europaea subsp. europaea]
MVCEFRVMYRTFIEGTRIGKQEENIKMPRPRGRSQRAGKRKPRHTTTLIDEFLDDSSPIRHMFFPNMKMAKDPNKDAGNDSLYYYPGKIWLDTEGNPIQAHGGGVLFDERSRTYYWYGEYKDGPTYHAHKRAAARLFNLSLLSRAQLKKDSKVNNSWRFIQVVFFVIVHSSLGEF